MYTLIQGDIPKHGVLTQSNHALIGPIINILTDESMVLLKTLGWWWNTGVGLKTHV